MISIWHFVTPGFTKFRMLKRLFLLLSLPLHVFAAPCQPIADLIERDKQYEEALRIGDVAFLQAWLADEYIWVHSLASQTETKPVLLARSRQPAVVPKSRSTDAVQAQSVGDTVVLRGQSTVEQWNPDGKTWRSNRYQFMRTYVSVGGHCKLLAVQTMKVWSSATK